ncbi:hypothetical protein MLD38_037291 [Melastoma candidum]|uniref:Uncharacterized protein n=1 Tax=Melastoma candidum TaxID=119954 RepID=A0ACB9LP42_9MYRT|nr:hypothetical protein MLD38_037291 [Melastoma candidum]
MSKSLLRSSASRNPARASSFMSVVSPSFQHSGIYDFTIEFIFIIEFVFTIACDFDSRHVIGLVIATLVNGSSEKCFTIDRTKAQSGFPPRVKRFCS